MFDGQNPVPRRPAFISFLAAQRGGSLTDDWNPAQLGYRLVCGTGRTYGTGVSIVPSPNLFSKSVMCHALRASRISASKKPSSSILVSLLYQARTYFQNR